MISEKKRVALKKLHSLPRTDIWKKRFSDSMKGKKQKKRSKETRRRISKGHIGLISGSKHWNWKGGISNIRIPYPPEFNPTLKLKIRTRDNFICQLCGKTEKEELEAIGYVLCVNHIDFDRKNCKENNLNTLCRSCNVKIIKDRTYWTNYFLLKTL